MPKAKSAHRVRISFDVTLHDRDPDPERPISRRALMAAARRLQWSMYVRALEPNFAFGELGEEGETVECDGTSAGLELIGSRSPKPEIL